MRRLSTSRPSPSVPRRWPPTPNPDSRSETVPALGANGATSGAKMAARTSSAPRTMATIVTGPRRRQTRRPSRVSRSAGAKGSTVVKTSVPDTRIHHAVQRIDDDIDDHERHRGDQHAGLDDREVALRDRVEDEQADA